MGTDFHIPATSMVGRRTTRTLVSGEGFAVLDASGDIVTSPLEAMGFFHSDTRYLSRFELRVDGTLPSLLNSYLSDDRTELRVNLTNPDLIAGGETITLPRDSIQIERRCVLADGQYFNQILVRNFACERIELTLDFLIEADFADLFEVRGVTRKRHGQRLEGIVAESHIELRYMGLDEVERSILAAFDPPPDRLGENGASYHLELKPGATITITSRASAKSGNGAGISNERASIGFSKAIALRSRQLQQLHDEWAGISASHELFDRLLKRSAMALISLISERADGTFIMAGIPWFATLFGRDSIITAMAVLPYYPAIVRRTLRTLAHFQGTRIDHERDEEPGKIIHEFRMGEMAATGEIPFGRYYGSVDATPLFLWLLGEYVATTGDLALVYDLWPNIERALAWIEKFGDRDGDGYIEYCRETPRGLSNQGWKDSFDSISHANGDLARAPIALAEVQGYTYAAFTAIAAVSARIGHLDIAERLEAKAASLKRNFLRDFWTPEDGLVALALDKDKKPCRIMSSNAAHCLASGLFDGVPVSALTARLMAEDMFCGWGIRTLSSSEVRFNPMSYHNGSVWPHDNGLAAMGLARFGDGTSVVRIVTGLAQAAEELEVDSLPELFCGFARAPRVEPVPYPVACHPQAWASASVFMLVTAMLGMRIDGVHQQIRFDKPKLPEWIDSLQINQLQAGRGSISLLIKRTDTGATIEILDGHGDVSLEITK
jgi:glycogen debranching enzyme